MASPELKGLAGKTVLVVDDEEVVVDVIQEAMSHLASTVEAAFNGVEALSKVIARDFDFILLDIEMPRMNGIEFFKHVSEIKPYLLKRIIFITGDVETEGTRSFIRSSGCLFIDKPFMLKDLFRLMAGCEKRNSLRA